MRSTFLCFRSTMCVNTLDPAERSQRGKLGTVVLTLKTRGTGHYTTAHHDAVLYAFSFVLMALDLVWPDFQNVWQTRQDWTLNATCAMVCCSTFPLLVLDGLGLSWRILVCRALTHGITPRPAPALCFTHALWHSPLAGRFCMVLGLRLRTPTRRNWVDPDEAG
jgi:hypothetical protein